MHYNIMLLIIYSIDLVISYPVLQRKITPHPIKRQKEAPKPKKKTIAQNEVSEIQYVKALVCLKCILVFDEFNSFYDHKC